MPEWLAIAGQVGMNAKGDVASGVRRQTEQALRNIQACLARQQDDQGAFGQAHHLSDRRALR